MNSTLQILCGLGSALLLIGGSAGNVLSIPAVLPPAGETRSLSVNFENSSEVVGVQFDLHFDDAYLAVNAIPESLLGTDHLLASRRFEDFTRIILYSPGNVLLENGASVLVTARLLAGGPVGGSSLEFKNIIYTNAAGDEIPVTQPPAPLENWRAQFFSAAELLNSDISGPGSDPDGDGVTNLVEFVLGTHPRQSGQAGESSGIELKLANDSMLEVSFWLARDHRGADLFLQSSDGLNDWQTVMGLVPTGEETADRYEVATQVPFDLPQEFFRLKVDE